MSAPDPGTLLNELVDSHWATAARHAWRQYEQRGRGAIVFPVASDDGEREQQPLRYLTFSNADEAKTSAFAKMYELVESYDPESEVVAAAVLPDERTVFDVYGQDPPPPEA